MAENEAGAPLHTIALGEERLKVDKRKTATSRVRVETEVKEREEWVRESLEHENVSIERVPVGKEVSEPPRTRQEGDTLIIPVVEEVLVVEKRLVLAEELRITKTVTKEDVSQPVLLRSVSASIERLAPGEDVDDG